MKRFFKIIGIIVLLLVVAVGGLVGYVKMALPNIAVPEMAVQSSPELIERGRYLANNVMVCIDCHSTRDFSLFSGPLVPGTIGVGGERFGHDMGLPGEIYSVNITPVYTAGLSDGELYRAITSGVSADGHAMFNIMPYLAYGQADIKDIEAVIAYIRSLEPVKTEALPERELDFPVNILVNTMPAKPNHQTTPDKSNVVEYGRYMTTIAACAECHTPMSSPGKLDMKMAFGGGFEFNMPDGSVIRSMNITPHATGIGGWTKEMFITKFKGYDLSTYTPPAVAPGDFQTIMPWTMYAGMTEEDLGAIYEYLRTVPPLDNTVERFSSPSERGL